MRHIKKDCKNNFNTKKKDTSHIPFQSIIYILPYLSFNNLHGNSTEKKIGLKIYGETDNLVNFKPGGGKTFV